MVSTYTEKPLFLTAQTKIWQILDYCILLVLVWYWYQNSGIPYQHNSFLLFCLIKMFTGPISIWKTLIVHKYIIMSLSLKSIKTNVSHISYLNAFIWTQKQINALNNILMQQLMDICNHKKNITDDTAGLFSGKLWRMEDNYFTDNIWEQPKPLLNWSTVK